MLAVCAAFYYLKTYELMGYPEHALQLYFYLLVLKYKKPVEVIAANSSSTDAKEKRTKLLDTYPFVFTKLHEDETEATESFRDIFIENPVISKCNRYRRVDLIGKAGPDYVSLKKGGLGISSAENSLPFKDCSLSLLLYPQDGQEFDRIQNFHLLEYLFRRVELYDTAFSSAA